jgi:hypothetical protein
MKPELPDNLAVGRRAILPLPWCDILEDFAWYGRVKKWSMRIRVTCGDHPSTDGLIGPVTHWWVVASPSYPFGNLKIYPDKEQGIGTVFQHQGWNDVSDALPWRHGEICVKTSLSKLWRKGFTDEPFSSEERLKWHLGRAKEWIAAAIDDHLVAPGEPFELPPLPEVINDRLVFNEDSATFHLWEAATASSGLFKVKRPAFNSRIIAIDEFKVGTSRINYSWGQAIGNTEPGDWEGIWIMLKGLPIHNRWQLPATWGELSEIAKAQGLDIARQFIDLYSRSKFGVIKFFCIGFSVPERYGDPPSSIFWLSCFLESPTLRVNGFQNRGGPYMNACARSLCSPTKKISWIATENWNKEQISARGALIPTMQQSNIVLIGAGAVGSLFAELLQRLGCTNITIIDGERLEVGNLVRHDLDMEAVRQFKAEQLARRLNLLAPYAHVKFRNNNIKEILENEDDILEDAEIIVDATSSDEVIQLLSDRLSNTSKAFVSLSNGLKADRHFCFVSRNSSTGTIAEQFFSKIRPWLAKEMEENDKLQLRREGLGCWHPVFPARLDDIQMLLGACIKPLEILLEVDTVSTLVVIEKEYGEDGQFKGLRIVKE